MFACPICFHHRGAFAAPEEEEDRDPFNTGMHDEYDLDESGHIKAIHTCENAPEEEKPEAEVPIPETPFLWVDGNAPLEPCPECGALGPKLDKREGMPGDYHYCKSCRAYFVPKRGEGEK